MDPGGIAEDFKLEGAPACKKCGRPKPGRTHHCSKCNRCILKMDHHCYFVDQCIGYRNSKVFLQFLVSTTVGVAEAILGMVLICSRLNGRWEEVFGGASWYVEYSIKFWMVVLVFVEGGIGSLLYSHWWSLTHNMTTLEWSELVRANRGRKPGYFVHPFNVGTMRNLRASLGDNMLHWVIPTPISGSGMQFEVSGEYMRLRKSMEDSAKARAAAQ